MKTGKIIAGADHENPFGRIHNAAVRAGAIALLLFFFCVFAVNLAGCGADVDMILQNDAAEESGDALQDGLSEDISEAEDVAEGAQSMSESEYEEFGDSETDAGDEDELMPICVYICGAVASPGVYELQGGSRIWEVVEMAGGMTADADERSVNLAQAMSDGDMILVPTQEESAAGVTGGTVAGSGGGTVASEAGGPASVDSVDGKVNINTADVAELTTLNGIGDAKAEAIVEYRDEHGFFKSTDEIMEVSGIGEGTYDKIKDYIVV